MSQEPGAVTQEEIEGRPLATWEVPGLTPEHVTSIPAMPGEITAVVGANGSGKSALGFWLQQNASGAVVRRIIAHRRVWFEYAGPDITSARREQLQGSITSWGSQIDSRWRDHAQAERAGFVLFDLLAHINDYNGRFVERVKQGETAEDVAAELGVSLLDRINEILRRSHLGVTLRLTQQASFEAIGGPSANAFPISEMSDGEKSALLLAAEVMTVPRSCIVIVDEPERHLHRLISASLIEAIAADRPDCHFVVLTHDLELAAALPRSSTTLAVLSAVAWDDTTPVGWDTAPLSREEAIPESARRAILGGRRSVLFLEGQRHSLDERLFQLLFPEWTLTPVGSCEQVIRAVSGLADSDAHHWVQGRGIVDRDGRTETECTALAAKGILALGVCEVESLYYCEDVRRAVALRQADTLGKPVGELVDEATRCALSALRSGDTPTRLAASVAEKVLARMLLEGRPTRTQLAEGVDPVAVSVASPFPSQKGQIDAFLDAVDLEGAIRSFPIRDTALRIAVASALGFKSYGDYEAAALARISSDDQLVARLGDIVGTLPG